MLSTSVLLRIGKIGLVHGGARRRSPSDYVLTADEEQRIESSLSI
jgi:hypothetical protein